MPLADVPAVDIDWLWPGWIAGDGQAARIEWEPDPVDISADEAISTDATGDQLRYAEARTEKARREFWTRQEKWALGDLSSAGRLNDFNNLLFFH